VRGKTYLIAVILALLAIVTAGTIAPAAASAKGPNTTTKAWTYLVYLAADNSLETWGNFSLNLMEEGLINNTNVNVVVLYDRPDVNTQLLQVTSTGTVVLKDYGANLDTANPATLANFLQDGISRFPASHYAVDIWSHGGGWKYVVEDTTSNDRMSIDHLSQALSLATPKQGKFDIIIFDACLMSQIEVADQLAPVTYYMIASEQSVPFQGFPYNCMLQHLAGTTLPSPGNYSHEIVDDYCNYYIKSSNKAGLSITAIDESQLPPLVSAIDSLSTTLLNNMAADYPAVSNARAVAQHLVYGTNGVFWYVDLERFVDQLASAIPTLSTEASAVCNFQNAATYEQSSPALVGKSYGLGINFPPNLSRYQNKNYLDENYQDVNLTFVSAAHWADMLLEYYQYQKQ